jgi:hypothetical protein
MATLPSPRKVYTVSTSNASSGPQGLYSPSTTLTECMLMGSVFVYST